VAVKGLNALDTGDLVLQGRRARQRLVKAVTDARIERTIEGASTFTLDIHDPDRDLLREETLLSGRSTITVDDLPFELVGLGKNGDDLGVTFEAAGVADLRRQTGHKSVRRGTSSRTSFARQLVGEVKHLRFRGEDSGPNLTQLVRDKKEDSWDALARLAEERQWRRFEDEQTIFFGSDEWLEGLGEVLEIRERERGILGIDFDYDGGKLAATATVRAMAGLWFSRPGAPVRIERLGPLVRKVWLVSSISRSLFSEETTVNLVRRRPDLPEPKPEPVNHDDTGMGSASGSSSGGVSGGWTWPAQGALTGRFGDNRGDHMHAGLDIDGVRGDPIYAARSGTVSFAGVASGYGNVIYIQHDGGIETRYAHLLSFAVRSGQTVEVGQRIASMNSTGSSTGDHLHFEIRIGGSAVDPLRYLP